MPSETDLAWAAGIIDGEGCITITRAGGQLRVMVANTDLRMLHKLRELFGGNISRKKTYRAHYKPQWFWQLCAKDAAGALNAMLPYLVTKADQAELGLLSRRYIGRVGIRGSNDKAALDALACRVRDLKHVTDELPPLVIPEEKQQWLI